MSTENKYEFKGDKGEWTAIASKSEFSIRTVIGKTNEVSCKGADGISYCVSIAGSGTIEAAHNAHLIAAAPDLLAACINMVEMLHDSDPRTEEIRIAIHKALNIEAETA